MDSYTYELTLSNIHIKSGKIDIPLNFKEIFNIKFVCWAFMEINNKKYNVYLKEIDNGFYEMLENHHLLSKFKENENLIITIKPQEPIFFKKSPYTYNNPVRTINEISYIKEPTGYLCGQSCVAMLAARSVDEVIDIMNTDKGTHIEHIKDALEYYGIKHKRLLKKYIKGVKLPNLCILEIRLPKYRHWSLYFNGKYYDPEFGLLDECMQNSVIKNFLEILV